MRFPISLSTPCSSVWYLSIAFLSCRPFDTDIYAATLGTGWLSKKYWVHLGVGRPNSDNCCNCWTPYGGGSDSGCLRLNLPISAIWTMVLPWPIDYSSKCPTYALLVACKICRSSEVASSLCSKGWTCSYGIGTCLFWLGWVIYWRSIHIWGFLVREKPPTLYSSKMACWTGHHYDYWKC